MNIQLSFTDEISYHDNPAGISLFIAIGYAGKTDSLEALTTQLHCKLAALFLSVNFSY